MDAGFFTCDIQSNASSLFVNWASAMRLPESGRGFSSAEFFKRRIEWRDRAESAFERDVGDFLIGGDQQTLGVADAQADDIFPNGHRGVRLEESHHVAMVQANGIGNFPDGDTFKIVRVDVMRDGFHPCFTSRATALRSNSMPARHIESEAMQAGLDFQ
jgi:hypothetical protein